MKAVIEGKRNKEMSSYKASGVFNVPHTTLECYGKDRQKNSSGTVKTKLVRKEVLRCEAESDLAECCLLMERKFCSLTMADVTRLSYQLAVRNGIKTQFCKRNETAGRKWLKNFLRRHPQISVRTPEGLSLSRTGGFTPESVAQFFFKSTNPQWTPFSIILQDFTTATKPASLLYSTTHDNIRIERQGSDIFSSTRRTGISSDSRHLYQSNWILHSSVTCISKKEYEARTDEWHTAWINPRVPSLGVDTERDFFPVVSSFHQTYKADKRRSCYLSTGRALFTHQEPGGHYFSSRESC